MKRIVIVPLLSVIFLASMFAQDNSGASPKPSAPGQDAAPQQTNPPAGQGDQAPIFRVQVYARTTKAVNYRNRGGSTTVDFRGTDLMPEVAGHARVDGKAGHLAISAELNHLKPANSFGGQYLTYVLWAITPDGRSVNLGEILPGDNGKDKIDVTTDLQAL